MAPERSSTPAARLLVGTAGHIDHGKSRLVLALTGTDPDRLPEEKERGITIDLGFAHASWDGVTFSFVDVPGHERFVRTMVAGAYGIDLALLVVASDDGPMPQTREHLSILQLLGIRAGVVARTKSDVVDEETGQLVDEEIRELVKGTFLERAPVVPVSAATGEGLPELRRALVEAASARPTGAEARGAARPVRLAVDRAFTIKGFGPVVTGTLLGGSVHPDDRLLLLPEGSEVRVRRVEVHGEERAAAHSGERTSLNLAGVERSALRRGQTLVGPGALTPSALLTVEVSLLSAVAEPLPDGVRVRVHHGTADVEARLFLLPETPTEERPLLRPGTSAFAQVALAEPLPALPGDRFVLRRPSPVETLGGGRVLDSGWPRVRRKGPPPSSDLAARGTTPSASRRFLPVLAKGDEREIAALLLARSGPAGLSAAALACRRGIGTPAAAGHLDALVAAGRALRVGPFVAAPEAAEEMARRAGAILRAGGPGAASPLIPRGEVLERLGRGLPPGVAEAWLAFLVAARKVAESGNRVGPPGSVARDPLSDPLTAGVAEGYRTAGFDPPRSLDLARRLGTKPAVVEGLVTHLLKTGHLLRLSPDVIVHRDVVDGAAGKLAPLKGQTLGVAAFRDVLGLSRKYLIPLLELFDRRRLTRRNGDVRDVL